MATRVNCWQMHLMTSGTRVYTGVG